MYSAPSGFLPSSILLSRYTASIRVTSLVNTCKATGGDMAYLNSPPYDEKEFPAFSAIRQQFGFLPNFYPAQVARPDLIDAEIKLMESILLHEGALSRKQIEYIFLTCLA